MVWVINIDTARFGNAIILNTIWNNGVSYMAAIPHIAIYAQDRRALLIR